MTTRNTVLFGLAVAGVCLTPAVPCPAQGSPPASAGAPEKAGALPCGPAPKRSFMTGPQMPLPPELSGDVRIVRAGSSRRGGKPAKLAPFVARDFRLGPKARWTAVEVEAFDAHVDAAFGFHADQSSQSVAFLLAREDVADGPVVTTRCAWGSATATGSASVGSMGLEARVPRGSTIVCEFLDGPESEPWTLFLATGPPTNLFNPSFPSHGGLSRGRTRFEAVSTNVMNPAPLGMRAPMITGTVFSSGGRGVAAIERLLPGRVVMSCALPAREESLWMAVGLALMVFDLESGAFSH